MTAQDVSPGSSSSLTPDKQSHKLRGTLGVRDLLFTVLAFNGPLAIVVAFAPIIIGYGNGIGAPGAYLAAGVITALFAVGFMKMARHVPNPGGLYSFVTLGLGRPLGLGASFLALVCYYSLLLGSYTFIGYSISNLVSGTFNGPDIPWWLWGLLFQALSGVVGHFNMGVSAKILSVLLGLEIVVVLIYDGAVIFQGGAHGLSADPFLPSNLVSGAVGVALLFGMMCMGGFEATVIFRDEVRNPDVTIPRATYLFIVSVVAIFALSTWVIVMALGQDGAVEATAADPTGAFFSTMQTFVGTAARDIVTVLLCTSVIAAIFASHNVLTRYGFNLGADGILPRPLGKVHPKHGSPARASLVTCGAILIGYVPLILFTDAPALLYAQTSSVFGYAFLLILMLTGIAVPRFLAKVRPDDTTVWHRWIAPMLGLAGIIVTVYLATVNINVLITGGDLIVNGCFVLVYGSIVLGVLVAMRLKRTNPEVYRRIGRQ